MQNSKQNLFKSCDPTRCREKCNKCTICKTLASPYSPCWEACNSCNQCKDGIKRNDMWNKPYTYLWPHNPRAHSQPNIVTHRLGRMPVSQFCSNVCGHNLCKEYREQYDNYMQCQRCQIKNQCWSPYQNRCITCEPHQYQKSCARRWGCVSPEGPEFGFVAPINPMFTDCVPCWSRTFGVYKTF
jgi:hypothetical protein